MTGAGDNEGRTEEGRHGPFSSWATGGRRETELQKSKERLPLVRPGHWTAWRRLPKLDCAKHGASQVALLVKNLPASAGDVSDANLIPGWEDPLEEGVATHSSILAWRISRTEEPGGVQCIGSQRVRHD